jgi:hypothetical protein
MRHQLRRQLDRGLLDIDLGSVAVSAEADPATGDFRPVGGLEQKLTALASMPAKDLFACVLARDQKVDVIEHRAGGGTITRVKPDKFLQINNLREIPIVYASDPVDAILQVFELQARSVRIA